MRTAEDWIKELNLEPHPEGGFYRQTDRSEEKYGKEEANLPLYTNIYFLLTKESPSHFHQLVSDELWFYHGGNPLTVHSILTYVPEIYNDGGVIPKERNSSFCFFVTSPMTFPT